MKYIITEEQNLRLKFLRRTREITNLIKNLYSYQYPCDFEDYWCFVYSLKNEFFESLVADWLHSDEEDELWKLIMDIMRDELTQYYFDMCKRFDYE